MKVADLGEFNLIEKLRQIINERGAGVDGKSDLLIGIGDDAAVWHCKTQTQLGTTDTLVEGIHFDLNIASWHDLGWKALAVNISDIAAMGGIPSYALVSLGLPADTELERIIEFYEGMARIAGEFNMSIAGGDISESPLLTITPTVIGNIQKGKILIRSGATSGELIAVTGQLGASAAGLKTLKERIELDSAIATALGKAHIRPWPRVIEGQILTTFGVKSAIDISDGLLADLTHICQASHVGANLYLKDIPVHLDAAIAFPENATEFALSGGEDYELLFTASNDIIKKIRKHTTTPVTIIGEIVNTNPGSVTLLGEDGSEVEVNRNGWQHFGSIS